MDKIAKVAIGIGVVGLAAALIVKSSRNKAATSETAQLPLAVIKTTGGLDTTLLANGTQYTTNGKLVIPASATNREAQMIEQISQTIGTTNTYANIVRAAVGDAWDWGVGDTVLFHGSEVKLTPENYNNIRVTAMRETWEENFPNEPVPVSLQPAYEPTCLEVAARTGLSILHVQTLALKGDPGLLNQITVEEARALGAPVEAIIEVNPEIPFYPAPSPGTGETIVVPYEPSIPGIEEAIVAPDTGFAYIVDPNTGNTTIVIPPYYEPAPPEVPVYEIPGGGYIDQSGLVWYY